MNIIWVISLLRTFHTIFKPEFKIILSGTFCISVLHLTPLKNMTIFKNWSRIDIPHYSSFRCTTQWFDIYIHYEMMTTISLVTICLHIKLLQYHWLYPLGCTLYPYDTYFITGKFIHINPLHLFHLFLTPPSSGNYQFSVLMTLFLFCLLVSFF